MKRHVALRTACWRGAHRKPQNPTAGWWCTCGTSAAAAAAVPGRNVQTWGYLDD